MMSEWTKTTLGKISKDNRGYYGIGAPAVKYSEALYTYLRITDINDDGTLNKNNMKSVNEVDAEKYLLAPNDIVFARTGNSTGRSYFYDGSDGELVFAGFLIKFSLDEQKVNPKFMKYYTLSDDYKGWVKSFNAGSTRGNINANTYANMKLTLPPRLIQDCMVSILSSLDDKIENNRRICEKLEKMAQAIFKQWFVEFNFPDENGEPYKDNGGEMVESELGLIPKGWKIGTLDDVGTIVGGSTPSKKREDYYEKGTIPWITPRDLSGYDGLFIDKGELSITQEGYDSCSTKLLEEGSILFTSRAPIGYIAIASNEVCTNQGFKSIVPDKGYETEYLFEMIKQMTPTIINAGSGSTFKEISGSGMKNISIVLPSKGIVNTFSDCTSSFFETIKIKETENKKLRKVRDTLLPKLMSGKFNVEAIE